jgi:F-box domain
MADNSFVWTARPANFDAVPNEVLDLILSFIDMANCVVYILDENEHDPHYKSQVIALMHVSRTFRRAVLRARFWHEYDFDFFKLAWNKYSDLGDDETRRNYLYRALFSDDDFLRNLERKTDWMFPEPALIVHALAAFPNFFTTVRRLHLCLTDSGINFALRNLQWCNEIMELEIDVCHGSSLDLSLIGCFKVKRLDIRTLPAHHFGELKDLSGLESYSVQTADVKIPYTALPLASADTLTSLSLSGYVSDNFTLEPFTNLNFLGYALSPYDDLREGFFEVLASCRSTLRRFDAKFRVDTRVGDVARWVAYQSSIFVLPCLKALKDFRLEIAPEDDWRFGRSNVFVKSCMDIVEAMTSHLSTLEQVNISGGLDVSRLQLLGDLKQLKELTWSVGTGQLRGVAAGSDLTRCIPTWFHGIVEHPTVSIDGGVLRASYSLSMIGTRIERIYGTAIFEGNGGNDYDV